MSLLKNPYLDLASEVILLPSWGKLVPFPSIDVTFEYVLSGGTHDGSPESIRANYSEADQCYAFIRNGVLRTKERVGYYVYYILDGKYAGNASVELVSSPANISIELNPEYWGLGYGTEIYRTLIEWVRIQTKITLLSHMTRATNTASIRLAERVWGHLQQSRDPEDIRHYLIPVR